MGKEGRERQGGKAKRGTQETAEGQEHHKVTSLLIFWASKAPGGADFPISEGFFYHRVRADAKVKQDEHVSPLLHPHPKELAES